MKHYNAAQRILIAIGGRAALVAGLDGMYWPDEQMAKKGHKRPLAGRGNYGRSLKTHFDKMRVEARRA